jgi:divalent metal cation (Fe/Co/Zn/Cd) transporter
VLLTIATGNPIFDALGTLAIGVLLVVVAICIGIEVKTLLIGRSVDPELRNEISAFVEQRPEVARVFKLITLQLGPDVMVSIKAEMQSGFSATGLIEAINAVERDLKARFPEIRWSFFEPDIAD